MAWLDPQSHQDVMARLPMFGCILEHFGRAYVITDKGTMVRLRKNANDKSAGAPANYALRD